MFNVAVYYKEHVSRPDDTISGSGRPKTRTSSKGALLSLGHTINFIENWLQCFEVNYQNIITIYKINMSELFKTIPKYLHPKTT